MTPLSRTTATTGSFHGAPRSTALALAVLTVLTTFTALGPAAAPAQAEPEDCPRGYLCVWKTDHATGSMLKITTNKPTLGTWDNRISAVSNRTDRYACGYNESQYRTSGGWVVGSRDPDPGGTEWGYFGAPSISSIKLVPTRRECYGPGYPDWSVGWNSLSRGSFANLDGDHRSDLLTRDKAGRLWFLPGNSTGKLVGSGWNAMNALTRHGDFTGDAREDLIAREAATGKLWLYPGTGTGAFSARRLIGAGGWNSMTRITAFGDLTGDSRADLLAVEKSTGKLWLYPGTGAGTFSARKLIGAGGWNSMDALTAPGDVTGDGKADLIAREPSTGKLWRYNGKAGALAPRVPLGGGWNALATLIGVGDAEHSDGRNDLYGITNSRATESLTNGSCLGSDCLVSYPGKGNGTFHRAGWDGSLWYDMTAVL
ncbi:FG-GAP-like repeat-containing protein [Streptomyces sp. NPDC101490]|uniref:FG-GAP-like repeat-containing protein n=1 Tax=Streptomyces sp. NPDC101490 TaxID=3366143 RepID=UPI00382F7C68